MKPNFNNTEINWKRKVKYLGLIFDNRLSWVENIKYNMINKARIGMSKTYRLINKKSKLKTNLKLLLYKAIIRLSLSLMQLMLHELGSLHHDFNAKSCKFYRIEHFEIIKLNKDRNFKINKLHQFAKIEAI